MSRFEGYGRPFSAIIDEAEDIDLKQSMEDMYRKVLIGRNLNGYRYTINSESSITSTSVQDSINSIQREPTINLYRAMEENRRLKQELEEALAENKYLKEIIEEGDVNVKA